MFRATNSGVDKWCNLATARNATPCIRALSLIECQITICAWSWTSNKIFFAEKAFELLVTLIIESITFWPVTLQDSSSPNVFKFYVCICWHCWNLHLVKFYKWKRWFNHPSQNKAFWRVTQHGKLVSWQPIMAITNLLIYPLSKRLFGIPLFIGSQFHSFSLQLSNLRYLTLFTKGKLELALRVGLALK